MKLSSVKKWINKLQIIQSYYTIVSKTPYEKYTRFEEWTKSIKHSKLIFRKRSSDLLEQ